MSLTVGLFAPAFAERVQSQALATSASSAINWLEKEMAANGHHLVSGFEDDNGEFQTFNDTGLTIDGLLAIAAAGRNADPEAQATSDDVVANLDAYVTGFTEGAIAAGAAAKALLFAAGARTGLLGFGWSRPRSRSAVHAEPDRSLQGPGFHRLPKR